MSERTKIYLLTFLRAIFTVWLLGGLASIFPGLDFQKADAPREIGQLFGIAVVLYLGFLCLRSTIENRKFWSLGNMNAFSKLDFSNWNNKKK